MSRWGLIESSVITPEDSLSLTDLVLWPSVLYLSWQAAFSLTTEVILADRLSRDQTLVTSVRYVSLSNTKDVTRWTLTRSNFLVRNAKRPSSFYLSNLIHPWMVGAEANLMIGRGTLIPLLSRPSQ